MATLHAGKASKRSLRISWRQPLSDSQPCAPDDILKILFPNQDVIEDAIYATVSFARLNTVTLTFQTEKGSVAARKACQLSNVKKLNLKLDTFFHGLTHLRLPNEPDLDICALHGLEGNAIDTFTGASKVWLRDLLPVEPPFERARIMTFGYNSKLFDSNAVDCLDDWSHSLLQSLCDVRQDEHADARPIVFVCHSMGGLVARKAMERLYSFPKEYKGLSLSQCGLLFLGTPHSGTTEADYSDFLTQTLSSLFGMRKESILNQLKSFNTSVVRSTELWKAMEVKRPPFKCVCEGRRTRMPLKGDCLVVSQPSAGFLGEPAEMILEADHHGVCKFEEEDEAGFRIVLRLIKQLKVLIHERNAHVGANQDPVGNLPGYPPLTAYRYPAPKDENWYLGRGLKLTQGRFSGRAGIIEALTGTLGSKVSHESKVKALHGSGGIGKTEILLEYGLMCRASKNVFFSHVDNNESLNDSLERLAIMVGADTLPPEIPLSDRHRYWLSLDKNEKVDAFIAWIRRMGPKTLLLFDDVDACTDIAALSDLVRQCEGETLLTTRDPELGQAVADAAYKDQEPYEIPSMAIGDLVLLMKKIPMLRCKLSTDELEEVARLFEGHAMAACFAVQFLNRPFSSAGSSEPIRSFIGSFSSDDYETRNQFLKFRPRLGRSLADCFEVSITRLREETPLASRVLHFAAFLMNDVLDCSMFLANFYSRDWISLLKDHLPNYEIFCMNSQTLEDVLIQLVRTSALQFSQTGLPQMHSLFREYLLQRPGKPGRVHILRQIYLLATVSRDLDEDPACMQGFIDNCIRIARNFRIDLAEIIPAQELLDTVITDPEAERELERLETQLSQIASYVPVDPNAAFEVEANAHKFSMDAPSLAVNMSKFSRRDVIRRKSHRIDLRWEKLRNDFVCIVGARNPMCLSLMQQPQTTVLPSPSVTLSNRAI